MRAASQSVHLSAVLCVCVVAAAAGHKSDLHQRLLTEAAADEIERTHFAFWRQIQKQLARWLLHLFHCELSARSTDSACKHTKTMNPYPARTKQQQQQSERAQRIQTESAHNARSIWPTAPKRQSVHLVCVRSLCRQVRRWLLFKFASDQDSFLVCVCSMRTSQLASCEANTRLSSAHTKSLAGQL